MNKFITVMLLAVAMWSCKSGGDKPSSATSESIEKELQTKLINATAGDVIEIPEGRFAFSRTLSLDGIPDVTIRGAGMDKTFLTFKDQIDGAEGLHIKADGITLEGFTVEDTKGDAIKVSNSTGVTFRYVNTTWTGGAKETNGGYGLYPVGCTNVLIEHCEASYSSDAGIYVGQSNNVIMRNNYAHHNVAGIEIENCQFVEAYDNLAENNSGGFLIFDMPGLPQANGRFVKVYNNVVRDNNHKNFSPEGGIVNILPPGTGMLVLAAKGVEVYNNTIEDYKTIGMGIMSFDITRRPYERDNGYIPYCAKVHIYDNTFKRKGGVNGIPDVSKEFGKMINVLFPGQTQDIVIDGILDKNLDQNNGNYIGEYAICIRNNGDDIRFVNLNAEGAEEVGDLRKSLDRDMARFQCELPSFDLSGMLNFLADAQ